MQVLNVKAQSGSRAKNIRAWGIGILLVAALAGIGLAVVSRARGFTLADAEAFIGARLPAGARNIAYATRDQFGRVVWLRFALSPDADLSTFVAAMGLDAELLEGFYPFPAANYTEAELTWWTPHTAQVAAGLHAVHAGKVYELLLDRSDPAAPVVYLRVYSL
ncbi:MAG: hypothetical protein HXY41_07260 [Chloroflexi bacterium]|nr:hypothetical protein [Chloroflexota bacterium]